MRHLGLALVSVALAAVSACDRDLSATPSDAGDAATCSPGAGDARTQDADDADPLVQDAQEAILGAFDRYSLVGGMNAAHGGKEVDDFILALIRNPAFPEKVNDIAVECGNSLYQDILDRYIAGEDVPLSEARKVWRNTSQPGCGFSTFPEQLYPLVRRINQKLAPERKLRVLACDPPVDWSQVTSPDYFEQPSMDRDTTAIALLKKEVLEKKRKALLLYGIHHVAHGTGGIVGMLEEDGYTNTAFVIADHVGFGNGTPLSAHNDELEAKMASWPMPSIVSFRGTWLGQLDSAYFDRGSTPDQLGYPGMDAYLYIGRRDFLLRQPGPAQVVLDKDYVAELARRADNMGSPPNSPSRPEVMFERESRASAFNYDPR